MKFFIIANMKPICIPQKQAEKAEKRPPECRNNTTREFVQILYVFYQLFIKINPASKFECVFNTYGSKSYIFSVLSYL